MRKNHHDLRNIFTIIFIEVLTILMLFSSLNYFFFKLASEEMLLYFISVSGLIIMFLAVPYILLKLLFHFYIKRDGDTSELYLDEFGNDEKRYKVKK